MKIKEKVLKDNICKLHPVTSIRAIDKTLSEVGKVINKRPKRWIKAGKYQREYIELEELKKELGI